MGRPFLSPAQHQQIAERIERGESTGHIARAFGCSRSNVSHIGLKLGVSAPGGNRLPPAPPRFQRNGVTVARFTPDEDARLLRLEAEGLDYAAIGRAMKRHRSSVRLRVMTLARHEARSEAA